MTLTLRQRLLALVGVLLSLYTLLWFVAAHEARHQVTQYITYLNKEGKVWLEYQDIKLGGYPFNISLKVTKPRVTVYYLPILSEIVRQKDASNLHLQQEHEDKGLRHVFSSAAPILLQSDFFARRYKLFLPYECDASLNAGQKQLNAHLHLNNAQLMVSFRKTLIGHGMIKYFGQFTEEMGIWYDLKTMNWQSDGITIVNEEDAAPIYLSDGLIVRMRSHHIKNNGIRMEGQYKGEESRFGEGVKQYVEAVRDDKNLALFIKENHLVKSWFNTIAAWPLSGKTNKSFEFSIERTPDKVWDIKLYQYRAQDALSSSSMQFNLVYYDQEKPIVKTLGYYAVRYHPEWYELHTQQVAGDYAIPRLHDYEYLLVHFDLEWRKNSTDKEEYYVIQPNLLRVRTNLYTAAIQGGLLSTQNPYLSGRVSMYFNGYPAMMSDLGQYMHRIENQGKVEEPVAVGRSSALTSWLQKVADSSDEQNATVTLYNHSHRGLMVGKYPLSEILD